MPAIFVRIRDYFTGLGLKSKITLMASCLLLWTIYTGAFLSTSKYEQNAKQIISTHQFELASSLAGSIDDKLRIGQEALRANARHIPAPAIQGDVVTAQRHLNSREGLLTLFDSLFLLSGQGIQIAETPDQYVYDNLDFSYRRYFLQTITTKAAQISDPYLAEPSGQPAIVLTVPIMNSQGRITAVLAGSINLLKKNFLADMAHGSINHTGYLSLFNQAGTFIVHPDKSKILSTVTDTRNPEPFIRAMNGFEGTLETLNSRGQLSLSSFKRLATTNWILGISYPLEEAYAAIDQSHQSVTYSLLGLAVFALILTWGLIKYLLEPLKQLTLHVDQISMNPFHEKSFNRYRNDEIGGLAQTFNALMERLSKQQKTLVDAKNLAEEERSKSSAIIAAIGDAMIIQDNEYRVLHQNSIAIRLLGQQIGRVNHITFPTLSQTLRDGAPRLSERTMTSAGAERPVAIEISTTAITDRSGKTLSYLSLIRDITERKQAEEQIRKLSQAVEQSLSKVIITDTGGKIEYVNPRFTEITGYQPQEVIGHTPSLLQTDESMGLTESRILTTVLSGKDWHGELKHKKKNGEPYWLRESITPIRDENGTITNFLAVGEDITERRQLENQLRHSQKMEAIGQLAAGVAHDFNNILTTIVGYTSLQKLKAEAGSELMDDLNLISEAARRGTQLTRDLLSFSRKRADNLHRADLNLMTRHACSLLRHLISKRIAFEINLSSDQLWILADSVNLEQVLMNLATNASDAMPRGGTLKISTSRVVLDQASVKKYNYMQPGEYALLTVKDSGCGMTPQTVERVFEPFFTTKAEGKGTGLGLAISYAIIKQHKGYILCHSTLERGTVFKIYLPLVENQIQP